MGLVATAVADGSAIERGAPSPELNAAYAILAIESARAAIGKVGAADSSGPIRGTHEYMSEQYAFRDNAAADACLMYKESATGWVLQDLGNRVVFSLGTAEVVDGETLTQTGTTSTILRVVLQSGTFTGGDAAGYLIIGAVTSGPYTAATVATTAGGSLTTDGAEAANTMAAGGRYEFANDNFFGSTKTLRMYGVNGVSEAFEWDGTVFVPIITGNVVDAPHHLVINEFHLQMAFQNGSLQNSATGTPYIWAGGGANEIGVGHNIVGLKKEVGQVLIVLCRERTFGLYGKNTVASPWDLRPITEESGGIEWTMQRLGKTRYLDDRGFMSMQAVQEFGDFADTAYSQIIEPLVTAKKTIAVSSIIVRKKHQLRTFFSDGTAIVATFNNKKLAGFTAMTYLNDAGSSIPVLCTSNGEDSNGSETLFFGSSDGYLYQMDSGPSFDGSAVDATLVLSYINQGMPAHDKEYKKVTIEADGSSGVVLSYSISYDYASGREPTGVSHTKVIEGSGSYWDAANWDEFAWAAEDFTQIEGDLDGTARSISLQISSSSTYTEPYTLYAATFHYIKRKLVR
jgi:hypothetical protein